MVVDGDFFGLGLRAVVRVHPVSGDRTVVSGCPEADRLGNCLGSVIGLGPQFVFPNAIAVAADGALLVVDGSDFFNNGLLALVRVDPVTGNRTVLSDATHGTGQQFAAPVAMAVERDDHLVVISEKAVVRVHPGTGDRTVVSGCRAVDDHGTCIGGLRGIGPPFVSPNAIAVEASGSLVVVDGPLGFTGNSTGQRLLMRVHPVTGDRTVLSAPGKGHGPPFVAPVAVAVEADGNLLVTASGSLQAVLRVDPRTGDRSIVSLKGSEP